MRIARVVAAVAAFTLSLAATASAQTFDPPGSTDAEYTGSPTEETVIQALTSDGAGGYWGIDWSDRAYCKPWDSLDCTTGGGGDGYGDSTLFRFDSALNIVGSGGSFQRGQGTPSTDIEQYFNSLPMVGGASSHGVGGWVREWDETGGHDFIGSLGDPDGADCGTSGVVTDLEFDSPGRILAVIDTGTCAGTMIARLFPNLTLDTSFSGDGYLMPPDVAFGGSGLFHRVLRAPAGGFYVLASALSGPGAGVEDTGVLLYDANGNLDPSFSGDGRGTYAGGAFSAVTRFTQAKDGSFYLAGHTFVTHLNADGTLDTNFGEAGTVSEAIEDLFCQNQFRYVEGVHTQADGKVLVVVNGYADGVCEIPEGQSYLDGGGHVVRLHVDGTLDKTFGGGDGVVSHTGHAGGGSAYAAAGSLFEDGPASSPAGMVTIFGYQPYIERFNLGALAPEPSGDTKRPVISGDAAERGWMGVSSSWNVHHETFTVGSTQWLRCDADGFACENIAGATTGVYEPTAEDIGHRLRVREIQPNNSGPAGQVGSAISAPSAVIGAVDPTVATDPVISAEPFLAGNATLVAPATFEGDGPFAITNEWMICDSPTDTETCDPMYGSTYRYTRLGHDAVGKYVRLRTTASNEDQPGGGSGHAWSNASALISDVDPINRRLRWAPAIDQFEIAPTALLADMRDQYGNEGVWQFQMRDAGVVGAASHVVFDGHAPAGELTGPNDVWFPWPSSPPQIGWMGDANGELLMEPSATKDAVLRWKAPLGGNVDLGGFLRRLGVAEGETDGDGVSVAVYHGDALVAQNPNLTGTGSTAVGVADIDVEPGDELFLVIGAKEDTAGDRVLANVQIDLRSPAVFIHPPHTPTNDRTPGFHGVGSRVAPDAGTVTLNVYEGTTATGTPAMVLTGLVTGAGEWAVDASTGHLSGMTSLADGTYTVQARMTNDWGTGKTAPRTFEVDATKPKLEFTEQPPATTVEDHITFLMSTDEGQDIECKLDDGVAPVESFAPCGSPSTWGVETDGAYTFTARAVDAAGNESTLVHSFTKGVASSPPVYNQAPYLDGTFEQGETLTANTGDWTGNPMPVITHVWQRCDSADADGTDEDDPVCVTIKEGGATHELTGADANKHVRIRVTATSSAGTSVVSSPTGLVAPPPPPPVPTIVTPPSISPGGQMTDGAIDTTVGTQLTRTQGAYQNATSVTGKWIACTVKTMDDGCSDLGTQATYTPVQDDLGQFVTWQDSATNGSVTITPHATPRRIVSAPAAGSAPTVVSAPQITPAGTVTDGYVDSPLYSQLTLGTPPDFDGEDSVTGTWIVCSDKALTADCSTKGNTMSYTPVTPDLGKFVSYRATATNAHGSVSTTAIPRRIVNPPNNNTAPVNTAAPVASPAGPVNPGTEMSTTAGTWTGTPAPELDAFWERCFVTGDVPVTDDDCVTVKSPSPGSGIFFPKYTVQASDLPPAGKRSFVRSRVRAYNGVGPGYVYKTSNLVEVVPAAGSAPVNTVLPAIIGDPKEHVSVSASMGTWEGYDSLDHEWQICKTGDAGGTVEPTECTDVGPGNTYMPAVHEVHKFLRVVVTATNAHGSTTKASRTREVGMQVPTKFKPPVASPAGPVNPGAKLTTTMGSFGTSGFISTVTRWQRCHAVGNALPVDGDCAYVSEPSDFGASYTVTNDDLPPAGKRTYMRSQARAFNEAGEVFDASNFVEVVAATTVDPVVTPTPTPTPTPSVTPTPTPTPTDPVAEFIKGALELAKTLFGSDNVQPVSGADFDGLGFLFGTSSQPTVGSGGQLGLFFCTPNANGIACAVTMTVSVEPKAAPKPGGRVVASAAAKAKPVKLKKVKLTVLPGKNSPLKVKLTKAQKKKLAKMKKKRVKAKITVTQGAQTQTSTVVLPLDLKKK